MRTEIIVSEQDRQITVFLAGLIQIIMSGNFSKLLNRELSNFSRRMLHKAKFFESIKLSQTANFPDATNLLSDFFLFLWGGNLPRTSDPGTMACYQKIYWEREACGWEKIFFSFMAQDFENLKVENYIPIESKKRFWVFYFDGNFQILDKNDKDKVSFFLERHPSIVMEFITDKAKLNIHFYKSMFYGL